MRQKFVCLAFPVMIKQRSCSDKGWPLSWFVYKSQPSAFAGVVGCSAQCCTAHARLLLHNRAWSPVRHWCQYGDPASDSTPAPPGRSTCLSPCHSCAKLPKRHRGLMQPDISEDALVTFLSKTESPSNMSTLWDRTKTLSQEQFEPIQAVSAEYQTLS